MLGSSRKFQQGKSSRTRTAVSWGCQTLTFRFMWKPMFFINCAISSALSMPSLWCLFPLAHGGCHPSSQPSFPSLFIHWFWGILTAMLSLPCTQDESLVSDSQSYHWVSQRIRPQVSSSLTFIFKHPYQFYLVFSWHSQLGCNLVHLASDSFWTPQWAPFTLTLL